MRPPVEADSVLSIGCRRTSGRGLAGSSRVVAGVSSVLTSDANIRTQCERMTCHSTSLVAARRLE